MSNINSDIAKCICESAEHKASGNDLDLLLKRIEEISGYDIRFLGKNKTTLNFNISDYEFDKLSYKEKTEKINEIVDKLNKELPDEFNGKIGEINGGGYDVIDIYVYVTDKFDDGIEFYDVQSLVNDPEKAAKELNYEELKSKICGKLGYECEFEIKLVNSKKSEKVVLSIDSENIVSHCGTFKLSAEEVTVNNWNCYAFADQITGELKVWGELHLNYHFYNGGFNGSELFKIEFEKGNWYITEIRHEYHR